MTVEDNARIMEKVTRVGYLYDFYGVLLTERQREMFELYYLDDWSLAEIAQQTDVSRQAVHDSLHRAVQQLEVFEEALHLFEAHQRQRAQLTQLAAAWHAAEPFVPRTVADSLTSCLTALADEYQIEAG